MSWKKKLPMIATTSRIVIAPIIFVILLFNLPGGNWLAAGLFILASITDWLDGYWARKFNAESNMGKFMDPIADKILVLSILILLVYLRRVDPISPAILLSRDIFIGGIRSIAAADNVIIAAKPTGKWKAALQMCVIPCLFLDWSWQGFSLQELGLIGLWISVVLSLISGADYTFEYFRGVKRR